MAEKSIRFCVADLCKSLRAASWKIWSRSNKNDIYIACRELNGAMKLSLHQSNQWHIAYDHEFFETKVPKNEIGKKDRFIHKWERPKEIGQGNVLALRIVTPWTAVGTELIPDSKVKYIAPPQITKANEVGVFISEPTTQVSNWPAKNSMNSQLVGSYTLPNESKLWVVYWECECPDFSGLPNKFKFFNGVSKSDVAETIRAVVFGDHEDGSKVLYDLMGKKA